VPPKTALAEESLAQSLARRIRAFGPLTVEQYMREVLTHPRHGYYVARQPFGARGDFVTAPEVSQMFGELIGAWMVHAWQTMGSPHAVRLVELGPGRGTLMRDLLRAAAPMRDAAAVHLVEISDSLAHVQREALASGTWDLAWHRSFDDVPAGPLLLVANELFDALPVRQFVRSGAAWHERVVEADEAAQFRFVQSPQPSAAAALLPPEVRDGASTGAVAEVSPDAVALAARIGERVARHGGAALIIDYGATAFGARDTLQAVAHHRRHEVLVEPGAADLTAHVDFALLARAAAQAGARALGPVFQRDFLVQLGLAQRAAALMRANPAKQAEIAAAVTRLTADDQMGTHFKVLCIAHPGLPALPGFGA
jgi:NADH dehydrogenase [ubiquinone] 1 alpha subcomplex assembly factor 7